MKSFTEHTKRVDVWLKNDSESAILNKTGNWKDGKMIMKYLRNENLIRSVILLRGFHMLAELS